MMKTLRLNEGDPIRITGATLPKGKLIKTQAQQVHFLEVSDPKAVWVFLPERQNPIKVLISIFMKFKT